MKQKGFTLIELLVTMGIIAVLTGLAMFNFNQARIRARDVQRKSDLDQIKNALELYKNDNRAYPLTANYQTTLVTGKYIKTAIADPRGSSWKDYVYAYDGTAKTYIIQACLENKADPTRKQPDVDCGPASSPAAGTVYEITNP